MIVPSAAGGTTDFLARVSGEFLSSRLGQPVIIENNTGAGGNVGTASVARATDGHTFGFISTNNLAINQFLFKSLPYDPIKDLTPVAVVAEAPQILVVAKSVPAQNLKEFIALLKAKPNSLNYASAGPGTTPHLAAVQFMRLADVQMTHVPYRGAAPAVTDLASGQVQVLSVGAAPVAGVMASGDVRALAAATKTRMPLLPDLPTAGEAGLPGFEFDHVVRSRRAGEDAAAHRGPHQCADARMGRRSAHQGALRQGIPPADEHERGRVREVRGRGGEQVGEDRRRRRREDGLANRERPRLLAGRAGLVR